MLIITGKEKFAESLKGVKRDLMGNDHAFHNGGRGKVHHSKKHKFLNKKWNKNEDNW